MYTISVRHQCLELNWPSINQIKSPKTLILGSFNPYNGSTNAVDYYYGRLSNYFWKTIASIRKLDDNYYNQAIERKLEVMMNRFICMDVINQIDFSSENQKLLTEYIRDNIFSNYLDQRIWVTRTNFENRGIINLSRTYNNNIIELLNNTDSIVKVIHTMGNNRINERNANPQEKRLKEMSFNAYINYIKRICQDKGIEFIYQSYSPSSYAVNNGQTPIIELKRFLRDNLFLND